MKYIKTEAGERLREIRNIFFEGSKVSTRQFAIAVNETKDNIANYENGRANIPNRLLLELYKRGFNPTYILTGEGGVFADNEQGIKLKEKDAPELHEASIENVKAIDFNKLSITALKKKAAQYQVAAGDIQKIISKKSN